jgi:multicomponent Na+:H+ antiporter subunit F
MTPSLDPTVGWIVIVLVAAAAGPCLVAVCRGEPEQRLVALEALSTTLTVVLVLLARSSYLDVPLILALVSLAGSLVFARFFGRAP